MSTSSAMMEEVGGRPIEPRHRHAMRTSQAPASIAAIPDLDAAAKGASAVVRDIGCSRRVVLLQPYMSKAELEGLAYRVYALTTNESLNSVLIANYVESSSDDDVLSSMVHDRDYQYARDESVEEFYPDQPGHSFHVAGGYDPLELYRSGKHKDPEYVRDLLNNLTNLTLACEGRPDSKIPTLFVPHGIVTDSGFAWMRSSYVMATRQSEFRILHPGRGLALDPVGLSYRLPRISIEFQQAHAMEWRLGCCMLLGLTSYTANHYDLLETGLATNLMESAASISELEMSLAEIRPWNQQELIRNPVRYYGQQRLHDPDHNAMFRNVQVADTVNCMSAARADNQDIWSYNDDNDFSLEDPSLVTDYLGWNEPRNSDLLDLACTFDSVFKNASSVEGILAGFQEIAGSTTDDAEVQEGIDVAKGIVDRLQRQSPLALQVMYKLLLIGSRQNESFETCCARELRSQTALLKQPDFELWANNCNSEGEYHGPWTHASLKDVPNDLVAEIIGS